MAFQVALVGCSGAPGENDESNAQAVQVDSAVYNFESSAQGWTGTGPAFASAQRGTAAPFAGTGDLTVDFASASGVADVYVASPALIPGTTVTLHVSCSSFASIDWMQPYAQQGEAGNWAWTGSWVPTTGLKSGVWNTVTLSIPANATAEESLGIQFHTTGNASGTTCSIDSVGWPGAASGESGSVDAGVTPDAGHTVTPAHDAGQATKDASAPVTTPAPTTTSTPTPPPTTAPTTPPAPAPVTTGLHVQGNELVDNGKTVRLLGVDHAGTEYSCVQDSAIFEGPSDATLITPMLTWHVNTVRVPLNESCWLGINGVAAAVSGTTYQAAITKYVKMIRSQGLYVIVDLHWNGPGTNQGLAQQPMADSDHAPAFWTSVANAFKGDTGIVFDLYNEPYVSSWSCWLNGCSESSWNGISGTYPTAGMQSLVNAVRATGATNVLMLGGIAYSNDLSGWLANEPTDPQGQLAASFHNYNFNTCADESCWNSQVAPVAAKVPVVTGELGENDCATSFIDSYMTWADSHGISYMGWTWNVWDCSSGPALITDYSGTPTGLGAGIKAHLLAVN